MQQNKNFTKRQLRIALLAAFSQSAIAYAAETGAPLAADASSEQIQQVLVQSNKVTQPTATSNTRESINAKQIAETINAITTAETLNYLPSTHVRERYIGDRNGILVMRVNSSISSAQTVVYADNLLLSNFLNNSYATAPRWGMVAPEEIERIDVLYGPFSALYPGNSAGGVVLLSTHMPDRFEAHIKLDVFGQRFKLYGTDQEFHGTHGSVALGSKSDNWSWLLNVDHLDNTSQPQTFGAASKASLTGTPAFTTVSGAIRDIDTSGNGRIVTSAIGADATIQDIAKLKLAYDITPELRASYTLGMWENKSTTYVNSYLRDSNGRAVFNTSSSGAGRYVKFAGDSNYYTLAGTSPGYSESEHYMQGLSLASHTNGAWDWEAVLSSYNERKDNSRTAANNGSVYDSGLDTTRPGGSITTGDGTGWTTLDLRAEYRPGGDVKSAHRLSFGYHADRYVLKSVTTNVLNDWLSSNLAATPSSNSYGKTQTQALYLQDAWQLTPEWKTVFGGRLEQWQASDGSNFNAANATAYQQLNYATRRSTDFSPKLSVAYQPNKNWAYRASFGRGLRYPTVAEIFQVISLPNNVKQNDPNLKPEDVRSAELVAEVLLKKGSLRTSVFYEDKRDALISQSDTTVIPNISSIQNVDKVRTYGLETVLNVNDVVLNGLDFNASLTYTHSTIVANSRNPGLVDTDQPRIPAWRATMVATYHVSDRLSGSLSYRYSGHQHNALFNTVSKQYNDVNPDVYGAVSQYSVFDAKLVYQLTRQWTGAIGVNNIGSEKYYVNPNPYPQRTFFVSMKFDY
ncbi:MULTISPECIES: TonB-dependent receptor [unclassified Undibacterium]|uniref:TonB-dependent receptor n=1 Tax=unclassified Undibacterium TaxID=2630295 RepID=UPI002AC8B098|nr:MULTISPECIES: TonB-dependent receptor [unclassified Undibacterium]MEB0140624.1 TonB-dependent receptor [Undibacterium sp. CCC2.1]MEB0173653.1 TonB-dependent receptor [Undibacterium sp. CCC1.1]MEB0177637.1 TonB-dependent receptor [Undibacterium sp. CCC3.4]MEB0216846.1 TonB-dependent receptor [Undibacterium sp. 5I2]WPX41910.1 TonB-dependent receptor [Undibacterium sp. CCC3.4]